MPIITQTLNINNVRTTFAKSTNLHTIRKLVKYSLKNVLGKGNVYSYRFRDIAVRRLGQYCNPPSGAQGVKELRYAQVKCAKPSLPK